MRRSRQPWKPISDRACACVPGVLEPPLVMLAMRADGGMKPISSCRKHRGASLVFDEEPLSDFSAPLVDDLSAAAPVVTTFSELVAEDPEPAFAASGADLGADDACSVFDDASGFSAAAVTGALLAAAEEADGATGLEAVDESAASAAGAPLSVVVFSCGFASALEAAVVAEAAVSLVAVLAAVAELLESVTTVSEVVLGFEGLLSGIVPAAAAVFGASFPFNCSTLTLDEEALEEPPAADDAIGSL